MKSNSVVRIATATLLLGGLAFAGCTPKPEEKPTPSPTASSAPAKPQMVIDGIPADLTETMTKLYQGEAVTANPEATAALKTLKAPAALPTGGTGSVADWEGTSLASVAVGTDVTLLTGKDGKWTVVGGWWPSLGAPGPAIGKERLVLMMGSDARPEEDFKKGHADALQLVAFDGKDGGAILGTPRDTWVPLPSGGYGKINEGMVRGGPVGQLKLMRQVSGLDISHYMLIDFNGFRNLVEDVGGLKITLPEAIAVQGAPLPKGPQTLDGRMALRYARERKSLMGGDFDRSLHQGDILIAGAAMAQSTGPASLGKYLSTIGKYVDTDMNPEQVLLWFANVHRVQLKNIDHQVCKGVPGNSADGQSIVNPTARETQLYNDMKDYRLSGKY